MTRRAPSSPPSTQPPGRASLPMQELDKFVAAAADGDKAYVITFLAFKADFIDAQDSDGNTALTASCSAGEIAVATHLLDNGANAGARDAQNWSALHLAAYNGRLDIIELLLARQADIEAVAQEGWTPLMWACGAGQLEAAALLLAHGADIHAVTTTGRDMLKVAEGHPDIIALIQSRLEAEKHKDSLLADTRLVTLKSQPRKNPFRPKER